MIMEELVHVIQDEESVSRHTRDKSVCLSLQTRYLWGHKNPQF